MTKIKFTLVLLLSIFSFALIAQDLDGKVFFIQSNAPGADGRVIDADGYTLGKNGTKIQLWKKNTVEHQNWKFIFANKGANAYYIQNVSPRASKYNFLDASYSDLGKNGGLVQLWEDNRNAAGDGEPNQLWIITKNVDGTYRIASAHPKANGASLDADGYTQGKNGGKVQLWQALNNKNQSWKLIPLIKTYKLGDMHPDGGIVIKVNKEGTQGTIMWLDDSQTFSHDEAQKKVAELGQGWELPAWQVLQEMWRNLHNTGKVKFTGTYYWSSWRPSVEFAKYVRFGDGYTSDGPARNKFNICPTKNF